MTICVGIKVHDGIVFVADSASSLLMQGQNGAPQQISRVYNNGNKVFNLYRGLPLCAMTCGLGNFGVESVSTATKGLRLELMDGGIDPDQYTVRQVVEHAHGYFGARFKGLPEEIRASASFEFFVAGYSAKDGGGEVWKFQFSGDQSPDPLQLTGPGGCGIVWAGQPEACVRLVLGHAGSVRKVFTDSGLSEEQSQALELAIRRQCEAQLLDPAMPIMDAIELAEFLAQTSASFVKFLPGANTVGGDLDIATVTKYEGFRWIRRKHFYPWELNQETDHVR